jgi:hypothetical protein
MISRCFAQKKNPRKSTCITAGNTKKAKGKREKGLRAKG